MFFLLSFSFLISSLLVFIIICFGVLGNWLSIFRSIVTEVVGLPQIYMIFDMLQSKPCLQRRSSKLILVLGHDVQS